MKNKGFLLPEALASMMVLAVSIATISQVVSRWISRVHYSSDSIWAQNFLEKATAELLKIDGNDLLEERKEELLVALREESSLNLGLEIKSLELGEGSKLETFSSFLKPITATLTIEKDGKKDKFKLVSFKIIDTPVLQDSLKKKEPAQAQTEATQ
jgi:hypothetical protein